MIRYYVADLILDGVIAYPQCVVEMGLTGIVPGVTIISETHGNINIRNNRLVSILKVDAPVELISDFNARSDVVMLPPNSLLTPAENFLTIRGMPSLFGDDATREVGIVEWVTGHNRKIEALF